MNHRGIAYMSGNDWWNKNVFSWFLNEETDDADCTSSNSVNKNGGCERKRATAHLERHGSAAAAWTTIAERRRRRFNWQARCRKLVHTGAEDISISRLWRTPSVSFSVQGAKTNASSNFVSLTGFLWRENVCPYSILMCVFILQL